MRFLKRLSALLLAMLSLCSLVACKEEIIKNSTPTRPSVESELPESVTSEESATSDNVEPENSTTSESSSESDSSNVEAPADKKEFFQASIYDVEISGKMASDKLSVEITVVPKFNIHNLQIETRLIINAKAQEVYANTIERAQKGESYIFIVSLSEVLQNVTTIKYYDYDVIAGEYDAESIETDEVSYSLTFNDSRTVAKLSGVLSREVCLYDVTISVKLFIDEDWTIFDEQIIKLEKLPEFFSFSIYLPQVFKDQELKIQTGKAEFIGYYRYPKSANEAYWAQFE